MRKMGTGHFDPLRAYLILNNVKEWSHFGPTVAHDYWRRTSNRSTSNKRNQCRKRIFRISHTSWRKQANILYSEFLQKREQDNRWITHDRKLIRPFSDRKLYNYLRVRNLKISKFEMRSHPNQKFFIKRSITMQRLMRFTVFANVIQFCSRFNYHEWVLLKGYGKAGTPNLANPQHARNTIWSRVSPLPSKRLLWTI